MIHGVEHGFYPKREKKKKNPAVSPDRAETGFTFSQDIMGPSGGRSVEGGKKGPGDKGLHEDP